MFTCIACGKEFDTPVVHPGYCDHCHCEIMLWAAENRFNPRSMVALGFASIEDVREQYPKLSESECRSVIELCPQYSTDTFSELQDAIDWAVCKLGFSNSDICEEEEEQGYDYTESNLMGG